MDNVFTDKRVLVTGGGGFLGLEVVKVLLSRGYKVTSLSRGSYHELKELGVEQLSVDLTQQNEVENIDLTEFEAIFHIAALAGVWGDEKNFFKINFKGTQFLFNHAKRSGIKYFIYTSSPSVVFGSEDIYYGDESLAYPKKFYSSYAHSKKWAESYVLNSLDDTFQGLAIRPHLIWGKNDPHIIPRLLKKAREKKLKIIGNGHNLVDVVYVTNAAIAHVDALETLKKDSRLNKQAYFIGQEKPVNLWMFINSILERAGEKKITSKIPFFIAYGIGFLFECVYRLRREYSVEPPMSRFVAMQMAKNHYFNHSKAKNDFNYQAHISTAEGLKLIFSK